MPTKRRLPRKRKRNMFSPGKIQTLLYGFTFLTDGFAAPSVTLRRGTLAVIEAGGAWDVIGHQLLAEWIRAPRHDGSGGPGTRPWFWWYDGGHRRERIDGLPHPFDNPERQALVAEREQEYPHMKGVHTRLYFGLPNSLMVPDDFAAVYETQAEYIERLNLWLPGEKELLP